MRKLNRNRVTAPKVLTDDPGPGVDETKEAIEYFSKKKKPAGTKFSYEVYRHPDVKLAVSELSFGKCAYCEVATTAGFDGDVEHFRPKGEVTMESSTSLKPGYYWLGACWDNLYLSCQHCNQSRKQPTVDKKKLTMGKKNQFPLSADKKRIRNYKKSIRLEEPYRLLLDPCIDDPLDHLEFDDKGLVYSKMRPDNSVSSIGQTSIEVFAMLRKNLVEAREKHAIMVMTALRNYEDHVKELNDNIDTLPAAFIKQKKENLEKEVEGLKAFTREDQVFSAMSLALVKTFLARMGIAYVG